MCSEFGAHREVEEAGVAGAEPMRGREGGGVAVRGSWGQITGDVGLWLYWVGYEPLEDFEKRSNMTYPGF